MKGVRMGSWRCPSGNSVAVFLEGGAEPVRHLTLEWDVPPPLAPADHVFYRLVILPAIVRRVAEYLEQPGPSLVVMA